MFVDIAYARPRKIPKKMENSAYTVSAWIEEREEKWEIKITVEFLS